MSTNNLLSDTLPVTHKYRVLSLSDKVVSTIHSPSLIKRFRGVDLILGCGDLPYYYLEFALSMLDVPLLFVRGNHDKIVEYSSEGHQRVGPHGGINLHRKVIRLNGFSLAGVEGSLRYRVGPYQYSQADMWRHVISLIPGMVANRLIYGRFLDIFVTHAPPAGVHDAEDLPHQGINAFNWLLKVFKPRYHYHGHIHIYRPDAVRTSIVGSTTVINTFGYRVTELNFPDIKDKKKDDQDDIKNYSA